jgi:hypothetical protein
MHARARHTRVRATQADVAVLVISSRKGEYETGFEKGGQTREHAQVRGALWRVCACVCGCGCVSGVSCVCACDRQKGAVLLTCAADMV